MPPDLSGDEPKDASLGAGLRVAGS
jgi:hypothetical protein